MGGAGHSNPNDKTSADVARPASGPAVEGTQIDARAAAGNDLGFSLADQNATTDTPRGSSVRFGPEDQTIESGNVPPLDAAAHSNATIGSGAGTTGGGRRKASSGPVLAGFADYELIGEIARGGMGVVYRARQISLNRIVAVKMILAGQLASEADVQRFRSEAEAAANLQHPHIVSIYEVGEYGGQHYFSMQFIDGQSLSEHVRDGLLPARRAASIVQTICDAIQYAHEQGILHRDLKPSNILIDKHGEPHLTDFGVAKRLSDESQMTATGAILGTPGYMPPEQAVGKREVGPAADVYALGGILYELLSGRPAFKAERIVDVLMQVINTEPVSPRLLNPSVPEDLSTICLKCLEKDPARRYPSAALLSADIGRWLAGEPIEARPIGRLERAWRWCKRSPVVASLLALLVVIGIGAFTLITWQGLVAQAALREMQEAQSQRAAAQIEGLLKAAPESLTTVLDHLRTSQAEIEPRLREMLQQSNIPDSDHLRASLALLPSDPEQVDYLRDRILSINLAELLAVRSALTPHRNQLIDRMWSVLENSEEAASKRFSAGLVLAGYDPGDSQKSLKRWEAHAAFLSQRLLDSVAADPSSYEPLVEALRPARHVLFDSLAAAYRDKELPESTRTTATNILVNYASDQPVKLAELLLDADPQQFLAIQPRLANAPPEALAVFTAELAKKAHSEIADDDRELVKDQLTRRQATASVALAQLGHANQVWPLLKHSDDPRLRSWLIELFAELKTDPALLFARLTAETDLSSRRALLLALGNFESQTLPAELRESIVKQASDLYSTNADAGIHGASEWLLRQLGAEIPGLGDPARTATPEAAAAGPHWQSTVEGHTFAVIDSRQTFTMGSPVTEPRRSTAEKPHAMLVGRTFAIGTKEVTNSQFRRFIRATGVKMPPVTRKYSPDDEGPMIMVAWYRAAQYCRWLSEQAGVPEEQMCYPPIEEIKEGMVPYPDYLTRTGFRLPTEAEWEFACRAGAVTSRSYGNSEELLSRYGWYLANAEDRAWRGGSLKPNDFGLFDMYGNTWEWCQESWNSYWQSKATKDEADVTPLSDGSNRVLRGGSFDSPAKNVRSAYRDRLEKAFFGSDEIGFRVARTVGE